MSSQISSQSSSDINSIMNSEEYRRAKQFCECQLIGELRQAATVLKIVGRSSMRRKQQLVDAIMNEWCKSQLKSLEKNTHQNNVLPTSIKCEAMVISGKVLTNCGANSNNEYCSNHQHRYRLEKPDDCPICMDKISSHSETPLECGHWIHKDCLLPTNLHMCPVCRQNMTSHEVQYIFGENHQQRNTYAHNYYIPFFPDIEDEIAQAATNVLSNINNNNTMQFQYLFGEDEDENMNGLEYHNYSEDTDYYNTINNHSHYIHPDLDDLEFDF